jgi:arsenate reductase
MTTVIFACVHNAGRSQMAAAFFNALADPGCARAISAGTQPAEHVHPEVVKVMQESRFDLTHAKPQRLSEERVRAAQLLVTMGCGEACPVVPGVEREDWSLLDPKGQSLDQVRAIRDVVREQVEALVRTRGWERRRSPCG